MNWRKIYMNIINEAKQYSEERFKNRLLWRSSQGADGDYYEEHHIFPKSMFPKYRKNKRNLVLLTAREHFICHRILIRIWYNQSTVFALRRLSEDPQNGYCNLTSTQYEELRKIFSVSISKRNNIPEYKQHHQEKLKEWHQSEKSKKWREKFLERLKNNTFHLGCLHSAETKKKISESRSGKYSAWNKGLSDWWTNEMYKANREAHQTEEFREKMRERMKNNTNSLGYKHTEETKQNMSIAAKKRFENPEERAKLTRNTGKSWYNNGIEQGFYIECPEGWIKGRLKVNRPKGLIYKKEIKNES